MSATHLESLWDMLKHNAARFLHVTTFLTASLTANAVAKWRGEVVTWEFQGFAEEIDGLLPELSALGLRASGKSLIRLRTALEETISGKHAHNLQERFADFKDRLQDELEATYFLALTASERELFDAATPHCGAQVNAAFPSTIYEVDEAAKCLALGRSTASVFHSVRCLEAAIRAMSRCLGIPDPTKGADRSWHKALGALKTEIDRRWPPSGRLSGDGRLFEEWHAILASMQNPYRNSTMHLDQKYTDEEARYIFGAVGFFMKKVASRCDEEGEPKA